MKDGTSTEMTMKPANLLFVLSLFILFGAVLGSVLETRYPQAVIWQNPFFRQGMGTSAAISGIGNLLFEIPGISLLWFVLLALIGVSLPGNILAPIAMVLRGMAVGAVLAELYVLQGVAGLLTALLFVMPYTLMALFCFLLAAKESIRFSVSLQRLVRQKNTDAVSVRLYNVRMLVLAIFLLIAGLVQCFWLQYGYPAYLEFMVGK